MVVELLRLAWRSYIGGMSEISLCICRRGVAEIGSVIYKRGNKQQRVVQVGIRNILLPNCELANMLDTNHVNTNHVSTNHLINRIDTNHVSHVIYV